MMPLLAGSLKDTIGRDASPTSEKTLSPKSDTRSETISDEREHYLATWSTPTSSGSPSPEIDLPEAIRKICGSKQPPSLEATMSALWCHVQDKQQKLHDSLISEIGRQSAALRAEIEAVRCDTISCLDGTQSQLNSDTQWATVSAVSDLEKDVEALRDSLKDEFRSISLLRNDLEGEIIRINDRQILEGEIGQMRTELNTILKEALVSGTAGIASGNSSDETLSLGIKALREELKADIVQEVLDRKACMDDLETRINQGWDSLSAAVGDHARQHIGVLSTALAAETALRQSDKESSEKRFNDLRNQVRQLVNGEEGRVAMSLKSISAVREGMDSLREELSEVSLRNEATFAKCESLQLEAGSNGAVVSLLGQRMDGVSDKVEYVQEQTGVLGSRVSALSSRVMSLGGKTTVGEDKKVQMLSKNSSPTTGIRGARITNRDDAQGSSNRQLSPALRQMQRENEERERNSKAALEEVRKELAVVQDKLQCGSFGRGSFGSAVSGHSSPQLPGSSRISVAYMSNEERSRHEQNADVLKKDAFNADTVHPAVLALGRVASQKGPLMRMTSAPSNLVATACSPEIRTGRDMLGQVTWLHSTR